MNTDIQQLVHDLEEARNTGNLPREYTLSLQLHAAGVDYSDFHGGTNLLGKFGERML